MTVSPTARFHTDRPIHGPNGLDRGYVQVRAAAAAADDAAADDADDDLPSKPLPTAIGKLTPRIEL